MKMNDTSFLTNYIFSLLYFFYFDSKFFKQNKPKNKLGFSFMERHLPSVPAFIRLVGLLAAVTTGGVGGYLVSKGKL